MERNERKNERNVYVSKSCVCFWKGQFYYVNNWDTDSYYAQREHMCSCVSGRPAFMGVMKHLNTTLTAFYDFFFI